MVKKDHKQMMKDIRSFVSFNFNLNRKLSPASKSKITRYHSKLYGRIDKDRNFHPGLLTKGHNIYRPRNLVRKKQALRFVQASGFIELKGIPITSPGGRKIKLKFDKKNQLKSIQSGSVEKVIKFFDKNDLINQTDKHLKTILDSEPKVKSWVIITGGSEIGGAFLPENIPDEIKKLMNTYGTLEKNNHHSNWLNGLIGFKYSNQKAFTGYLKGQVKSNRVASKATKKVRRQSNRRGKRTERGR